MSCDRSVGFFLGTLVFSTNKTDPLRYNWNIVESGVKHYNPHPNKEQERTQINMDYI